MPQRCLVVALALLATSGACAAASPQYSAKTFLRGQSGGGYYASPAVISNSGVIAIWVGSPRDRTAVIGLWQPDGSIQRTASPEGSNPYLLAINSYNELAGYNDTILVDGKYGAGSFIVDRNGQTSYFAGTDALTLIGGINDLGVAVASVPSPGPGVSGLAAFRGDTTYFIYSFPLWVTPTAINNRNQAVGFYGPSTDSTKVGLFYADTAGVRTIDTHDGYEDLRAFDINDAGVFVGWERKAVFQELAGPDVRAIVSDGDALVTLPDLVPGYWSQANAINNPGWIVGNSDSGEVGSESMATLWANGTVYNITDLTTGLEDGSRLIDALDINDSGQIVALARTVEGADYLVRLDPVPEPAAVGVVAMGCLALGRRRR